MADDTDLAPADAGSATGGTQAPFNLKAELGNLRSSATDAARNAANTGVQRASTALDDVARLVEDAARQIEDKLGGGVGDYVRQASSAVNTLSATLKDKDAEDLIDDAKSLIRANPALAVGAAAAVGFVLTRLFKLGADDDDTDRDDDRAN